MNKPNCCYFHANHKGPTDEPCKFPYPTHVSIWHHTDGRIACTLDHHSVPAAEGADAHWNPPGSQGRTTHIEGPDRCPCGWRNVGILLVHREDESGPERLDACQVNPEHRDATTVIWKARP